MVFTGMPGWRNTFRLANLQQVHIVILFCAVLVNTGTIKPLHILSLLPFPDSSLVTSLDDGPALLPAVQLAIDHINQRSDVLPGFVLTVANAESGCDITDKTYVSFVTNVLLGEGPTVGIVGPRCIKSARAVSSLGRRRELSLINVHLTGSDGSSTDPYSFGVLGSTPRLVTETKHFLEAVGWQRIAVLYSSHVVLHENLYDCFTASLLRNSSVSINVSALTSPEEIPFSLIKEMKTRIVVLLLNGKLAPTVACLALYEKVVYPNFQMIWVALSVSDFNQSTEFTYKGGTYNCSASDIISNALNGGVFLNYKLTPTDLHYPSISGYNLKQFHDQYMASLENASMSALPNLFAPLVYDAVWALVLALNGSTDELSNYHYGMPLITNRIADDLLATSFHGVSGYIAFDHTSRFVNRVIDIVQLTQGRTETIVLANISNQLFIADTFDNVYKDINPFAIFTVLAVVLLESVLVFATHLVACFYRRDRSIKALSIKLNHFVFVGTYLFIIGTLFYLEIKRKTLVERAASVICHVTWSWVLSIGFTLVVGTVTVRVWRVYRIFVHYRKPGPFISNRTLVSLIILQILIDLIIAITWTLLDPIQAIITSEEASESDNTIVIEIERSCLSKNTLQWASILIGWKVLQLLSMLTLAVLTRKVKNKDFSTQNVQVASYILAFTTILGSIFYLSLFLNRKNIHWDFAVLSFVFVVIIGVCYCSILLPPVFRMLNRKYREGPPAPVQRMTSVILPQVKKVSTFLQFSDTALTKAS